MFPSPWFYPDDGGRFFVTAGFLVTKDPDTGWTNLGTYRAQVLGKDILGSQIIKGKHGDMHMKKYQERGELMPAAYVVGSIRCCSSPPRPWSARRPTSTTSPARCAAGRCRCSSPS